MSQSYDSSSIKILEGLDAVRKRPGMYIGSTDKRGLHHLVWEIVDNSIDEVLNGHGKKINVTINHDSSITVEDFGRGIPVDMHESGKSTPEVIFTTLHAGGKFGGDGYKTSGGLHGVGSSVVNALSSMMAVEINRDGGQYYIEFTNGGEVKVPLKKVKTSRKHGTKVTFKPNSNIFSTTNFDFKTIAERLRESAFLIKGLEIKLVDLREDEPKEVIYLYEKGILEFIDYLNAGKKTIGAATYFEGEHAQIELEFAFQYNDSYNDEIVSFVNNVRTIDGGTHESGSKTAITKAINEYARKNNLLKAKDKNLEGSDVREGLVAIISVRIPEFLLQFEGQTKSKLGTSDAKSATDNIIYEKLSIFLDQNKKLADTIITKAIKARQARMAAKKAREDFRNSKGKKEKQILSGKLTPAISKKPAEKELYLVEGDSAGGSAKQARDRKFQAILPLRGKIINTEKAKLEDILKNEEIGTIITTLGAGFGSDFKVEDIQYHKLIIMTDADTDGAHIQILILTFLYRYMRPLIENGNVFIALPPLYKVTIGSGANNYFYAWTDEELNARTKELNQKYIIQRYKGLGEMNPDQLWETTMDPSRRTLVQVKIEDIIKAEKEIFTLMGDQVDIRREWIETNIDFSLEDNFKIKK